MQPTNVVGGAAITPAVAVTIEDASGNPVTTATNAVTMAIGTNPSSGTLTGTLTVNAVAGVATFANLSINAAGSGYTLAASATGLTGSTSSAFNVTAVGGGIAFVQVNSAVPQTPQTSVTVKYTKAQTAGDLNVVVVGWNDSTAQISSVADSAGNTYSLAVGPTVQTGTATQAIYYAKNIVSAAANANTVTVTFNTAANSADIRIAEYAGLDLANPVDVAVAGQGSIGNQQQWLGNDEQRE